MEIYRLSHASYADLSGKGGLFGSGRWHIQGTLACYTASSRSLAALERLVHESIEDMPKLNMMTIWVPDDAPILRYTEAQLPKGWDLLPDTGVARTFSASFYSDNEYLLLQIPSAIIRDEYNYVINPLHKDFHRLSIVETKEYYYDSRIQKMIR
ncbi:MULTISPECIES: RES family NAD+ phosphorylase [Vibrio]|uniref:RES family NAD+ phosphorylase n=1 Tax=Vibrio TaxID=662 RepID=UPI000841F22B|nr:MULTISPECIES: RES family NAD+ phosphorylase [Vibrio]ODM57031.1 hypothetical protein BC455_18235 [Vibrio harveyi]USD58627.1 RES family NAD+ phosphorylase [Vibrio sp. SCSIO 43155]